MNKYLIEHKILTIVYCEVMENKKEPASFEISEIKFSHWNFNNEDGCIGDAWMATAMITAENYREAINKFLKRLSRIISRISLISQSYIEYILEPFLIHKAGCDVAYFKYIADVRGGGLTFAENERNVLVKLLSAEEIPEAFYYYWNDAVNAIGYSAKLLLMFSAIEALVKKKNGKKDWDLINEIFDEELAQKLFGRDNTGIRHRLVHGEYFKEEDNGKNYLEIIHNKVISYFNTKIIFEPLIAENIIHSQRHLWGNKKSGVFFLKYKDGSQNFNLKDLLKDFKDCEFCEPEKYEIVSCKDLSNY